MNKVLKILIISNILFNTANGARIKEISVINEGQEKKLVGYGLVVGLQRTGDSRTVLFTQKAVQNMLKNLGLFTEEKKKAYTKNVAAVMVTANISQFKKEGTKLDVQVASIGDATSLKDGILLLTPLLGDDELVYANAQGQVITDEKNNPTIGYILDGATVIRGIEAKIKDTLNLSITEPDFTSAVKIQEAINRKFNSAIAKAIDGGTIKISIPPEYKEEKIAEFISTIEQLEISLDKKEKVIVNKITGTIASGANIKIYPVRLIYRNLKIEIDKQTNLDEFIDMIQTLKVSPKEMIDIIKTLKSMGAIEAEVVII